MLSEPFLFCTGFKKVLFGEYSGYRIKQMSEEAKRVDFCKKKKRNDLFNSGHPVKEYDSINLGIKEYLISIDFLKENCCILELADWNPLAGIFGTSWLFCVIPLRKSSRPTLGKESYDSSQGEESTCLTSQTLPLI